MIDTSKIYPPMTDTGAAKTYYRFMLLINPRYGVGGMSYRVKEALEAQGHVVFCFTPQLFPNIFTDMHVDISQLNVFVARQKIDFLIFSDGLTPSSESSSTIRSFDAACGLLFDGYDRTLFRKDVASAPELLDALDFCIAFSKQDKSFLLDVLQIPHVFFCPPVVDRSYGKTPIANKIAFEPGVLCLQDATPDRIAFLERVSKHTETKNLPIRCFGSGWPAKWHVAGCHTELIYASRSGGVTVMFTEIDDTCTDAGNSSVIDPSFTIPFADKNTVVAIGDAIPPSFYQNYVVRVAWSNEAVEFIYTEACKARLKQADQQAPGNISSSNKRAPEAFVCLDAFPFLDDELEKIWAEAISAVPYNIPHSKAENPSKLITILGYFGMGNFGDELILSLLEKRIRSHYPEAAICAIGENIYHTLRKRGIYSVAPKDKYVLDCVLSRSCVALVVAGLLFNEGIRWEVGKSEMISVTPHSTIPNIAGLATLCTLNETPLVFYGVGAGPLDVLDARKLVKLMGTLGSHFITRDDDTSRLLVECGVADNQITTKADTAFLYQSPLFDLNSDHTMAQTDLPECIQQLGINFEAEKMLVVSLREYEGAPSDFAARIAQALDCLVKRYADTRVVFCVLDPSDINLLSLVKQNMRHGDKSQIFNAADNLEGYCTLFALAHAGLSMRYHCSLLLNSFGKPCVGIDYLPKVMSLYKETGMGSLLLPIDCQTQSVADRLQFMFGDYGSIKQKLAQQVHILKKRSAEAEDLIFSIVEENAPAKEGYIEHEFFLVDKPASERELKAALQEAEKLRELVKQFTSESGSQKPQSMLKKLFG